MTAYDSEGWRDFGVGVAGASAALVGLLFVAISINLQAIVTAPQVSGRAVHALVLLATPVFVSIALLIPQPGLPLGVELLALIATAGPVLVRNSIPARRSADTPLAGWVVGVVGPAVVLSVGLLGAGLGLLTQSLGGIYWLPVPVAFALLGGLFNAWVLLVEIVR